MRWIDGCGWMAIVAGLLLVGCTGIPMRSEAPSGGALSTGERAVAEQTYRKALEQIRRGRQVDGEKALIGMTHHWPAFSGPFANLGLIYLRRGDVAKAAPMLEKAVVLTPGNGAAWNALGLVRRQKGDFKGAEQAYRRAIAAAPEDPDGHRNLGILYDLYLDRPKAALTAYRACQRLMGGQDKEMARWIAVTERRVSTQVAGRERR